MSKSIAFVFPYNTWGGAYRSTYILANNLVERGWKVDIIFPIIPPRNGYKITSLRWHKEKLVGLIRSLIRRSRINFRIKFNVICVPWISSFWINNYSFIIANHWNTVKDVYDLPDRCGIKYHYIRDIEQWASYYDSEIECFRLPIKKIVVSEWISNFLYEKLSIKVEAVITNGTDIEPFTLNSEKPSELSVGMCYGTHPMKGGEYGIEGIAMAKEKINDLKVILFGYEKPKGKVRFEYEWFQSPRGEVLRDVYRKIHIFISPSLQEGFHNPPREAMAAKCSVIATNVGSIPHIGINKKNLLIVDIKDPKTIAEKIIYLYENDIKRKKLAENGFSTIKNETWESRVDSFEYLMMKSFNFF